jgi:sigma54-dependent transcription regulator
VAVDCTAIPAPLFESEMFGHEKGAFTGATAVKRGLFQQADGGSRFLPAPPSVEAVERGAAPRRDLSNHLTRARAGATHTSSGSGHGVQGTCHVTCH